MTEEAVLDYLDDIVVAAKKIDQYTNGMTFDAFETDDKTVDAVLRNFEVIGEAAKNVPATVRQEYSDVPVLIEQVDAVRNELDE